MHPQLQTVLADLERSRQQLRRLQSTLRPELWERQPPSGGWSPAECVEHLNLTTMALLPALRAARLQASEAARKRTARYRFDFMGLLVWMAISPSGRLKTKTTPAFKPSGRTPGSVVIADFERLQAQVASFVQACPGLPIDRVTMASPFNDNVRFNVYAALKLVARHQQRHLRQAERAIAALHAPQSAPEGLDAVPAGGAFPRVT